MTKEGRLDTPQRAGYRLPVDQQEKTRNLGAPGADSPILVVPYMWIGDFVRCHSVIKLLKARYPQRPVDLLSTTLCAPLLDYMPGVRKGVIYDLPRKRLALGLHRALAARLAAE